MTQYEDNYSQVRIIHVYIKQINQKLHDYEIEIESVKNSQEKVNEQEIVIQQLKEEDELRKKKFALVKSKYEQEAQVAQTTIQQLQVQLAASIQSVNLI